MFPLPARDKPLAGARGTCGHEHRFHEDMVLLTSSNSADDGSDTIHKHSGPCTEADCPCELYAWGSWVYEE